jgi:hypothetical protein
MKQQCWNTLFIIATLCPCALPARATTGKQGRNIQGHKVQGHKVQGHSVQGSALQYQTMEPRAWLQGERLIAMRTAPGPDNAATHDIEPVESVEIIGFHGHEVLALVWRKTSPAGWKPATLSAQDLVGLTWLEHRCESRLECERVTYRIAAAQPDTTVNTMPEHADNRDIWLYRIEYIQENSPGRDDWHNVCSKDGAGGPGLGMFVDGRWNPDGSWQTGGYTFACTSGVVAKCARGWGYKPWERLVDTHGRVVEMRPLHQACTRAARADYCGDGISHTRDGTVVDMFDVHGFNRPESHPEFAREAGFSPNGARWVARERWPRRPVVDGPWTILPTCHRRASVPPSADDPVLVQVTSRIRRAPDIAVTRENHGGAARDR